jgi:hypothetical protein
MLTLRDTGKPIARWLRPRNQRAHPSAYYQLWHMKKSFRMSKHDLQARMIYHYWRDSVEAR